MNHSPTNHTRTNTMGRLRRFAIGAVAAVAGFGLASAGATAAATSPVDEAPASNEVADTVAYVVQPGGIVEFNDVVIGSVTGGYLLGTGSGVIELSTGGSIDVTSSSIIHGWGGFMSANFGGMPYFGELEAMFPGTNVYELEMDSPFGTEIDIEFLTITPVS